MVQMNFHSVRVVRDCGGAVPSDAAKSNGTKQCTDFRRTNFERTEGGQSQNHRFMQLLPGNRVRATDIHDGQTNLRNSVCQIKPRDAVTRGVGLICICGTLLDVTTLRRYETQSADKNILTPQRKGCQLTIPSSFLPVRWIYHRGRRACRVYVRQMLAVVRLFVTSPVLV